MKKKIKVLHVLNLVGGVEICFRQICQNIDESIIETSVVCPTGPQPKLPTKAPVLVATLGTTPVKSISFTVTAGDAEGVNNAMILSYSFV